MRVKSVLSGRPLKNRHSLLFLGVLAVNLPLFGKIMQWGSVSEFLAMGSYGLYVWGAYVVAAVIIAGEVVTLVRRGRTLRAGQGRSSHAGTG
jgi:heme exporter protein D